MNTKKPSKKAADMNNLKELKDDFKNISRSESLPMIRASVLYEEVQRVSRSTARRSKSRSSLSELHQLYNMFCARADATRANYKNTIKAIKPKRVNISPGAADICFDAIFQDFANDNLTMVFIDEPNLQTTDDIDALNICIMELRKKAKNLCFVNIVTNRSRHQHKEQREQIEKILATTHLFNIVCRVQFTTTKLPRLFYLNSGCIAYSDRGIHMFIKDKRTDRISIDSRRRFCHPAQFFIYKCDSF